MRWLCNYLRQCFCKHEFEMIGKNNKHHIDLILETSLVYRCKKCGYAQEIQIDKMIY